MQQDKPAFCANRAIVLTEMFISTLLSILEMVSDLSLFVSGVCLSGHPYPEE